MFSKVEESDTLNFVRGPGEGRRNDPFLQTKSRGEVVLLPTNVIVREFLLGRSRLEVGRE